MKPRRSTATVLVFFVAAMVAWFVVRSHVTPPVENLPQSKTATRPVQSQAPRETSSPVSASGDAALPMPSPQVSVSTNHTPPSASVAPASQVAPTLKTDDPVDARSDAASVNAIKVRRMITDYHTLTGENPVGTNAEIVAALMGKNPRQAILGPPEGMGLNGKGELIDDWGTPYFFHQLSKDIMEIHSAGPDKILGTADDIVVR